MSLITTNSLPWVEKHRPQSLEDIRGHADVVKTFKSFLEAGQLPHVLLYGPPGTGKTSMVHAISKALYGTEQSRMVLELNASDERGIAVVRNEIKTFAQTKAPTDFLSTQTSSSLSSLFKKTETSTMSTDDGNENRPLNNASSHSMQTDSMPISESQSLVQSPFTLKLIVLDEVDQMTAVAQMALRRIMEKYAPYVRFFLMCNELNKVAPPIQSRCTKFRFRPLPTRVLTQCIKQVAAAEQIIVAEEGIQFIAESCNGDLRRMINTLQSAYSSVKLTAKLTVEGYDAAVPISVGDLYKATGTPPREVIEQIKHMLHHGDAKTAYQGINKILRTERYSFTEILTDIYNYYITVDWPNTAAFILFSQLADIEERLMQGGDEKLQVASLIAAVIETRYELTKLKKAIDSLPSVADQIIK